MLYALLQVAAEEAAEAEPSKVPFYIAGGLFAVWALVLFAIGMRNPDFPGPGGARGVIAVSLVLMVAAMATSVITA